jgi:cell division protease FtsH
VHKVTIIPRGRALGLTQQLPSEDRLSMTREFARTHLHPHGRARGRGDHLGSDQFTTGAGNDIERATELAPRWCASGA